MCVRYPGQNQTSARVQSFALRRCDRAMWTNARNGAVLDQNVRAYAGQKLCKSRMCPASEHDRSVPRGCRSIDANAVCTWWIPDLPSCAKHGLPETLSIVILDKSKTSSANGLSPQRGTQNLRNFGSELHAASLITACINTAAPASRSSGRVSSRTLWLRPPTLGTHIIPDGQIRAIICAS